MLTYDEIVEYIKDNGLRNLMTPYQGQNGIGVVYNVEIEDYGAIEQRLATFDNIAELTEFADKLSYSDRVSTTQRDLIVSEPKFMLRGKVLTTPVISAEKKRSKLLDASKKEYTLYRHRRGQVLILKVEKIQKEIAELEATIKQYTKKGTLLFKNDLPDKKSNPLPSSDEFDLESLPTDNETILEKDFIELKITYEKLRRQKQLLLDKLAILTEFAQKSFLQKLKTSQKEIDLRLSQLDDQADLIPHKTHSDLASEENKIRGMLGEFDSSSFGIYPEFYLELLNFFKTYDSMSIDSNSDVFIENESSILRDIIATCGKERARLELEDSAPTQEEKNTSILLALKKQYDEHLSQAQKDALLIYNSQFFGLIGEISNIEGFENMDNLDILNQIKQSPLYPHLLKSIHSHCIMILNNEMRSPTSNLVKDEHLAHIMSQLLPDKTPEYFINCFGISVFDSSISINSDTTETFTNLMCDLIGRLKLVIKEIQNIPQDAIILPEDITVYRGVDSRDIRDPKNPAKGVFISTSMSPQIALQFGKEIPSIYKIHLKKGTPVKILPQKVHLDSATDRARFILDADPSDSNGTKEILLCAQDMQEFEITESITPITHYKFENGEFEESKCGFVITGKMEPRVVQQIRQENEEEK